MAQTARRSPRRITLTELATLEQALAICADRIDRLERAMEINIKRMGAMQAEIDHLRAVRGPQ